jgi:predicted amidohydrolase YtcJ
MRCVSAKIFFVTVLSCREEGATKIDVIKKSLLCFSFPCLLEGQVRFFLFVLPRMNNVLPLTLLVAVLSFFWNHGNAATFIYTNAKIYTVSSDADTTTAWAQAIAFDDTTGLILSVGSEEDVLAQFQNSGNNNNTDVNNDDDDPTIVVDLQGRLILPGFQDAHLHAVEAGINANLCLLDCDAPIPDWRYYFEDTNYCPSGGLFGDQGWIVGAGIDLNEIQFQMDIGEEYPITVLDRDYPNTPVLILDAIGHGAAANTAAMRAVGYDILDVDPPGGFLGRDPDTGALTGLVYENAQQPLRDAAFPPTTANSKLAYQYLLDALALLNSYGITSVSDAGGFWRQAQTEAWAEAERNGRMTVRASNALYIYPDQPIDEQLPELLQRFSNDADQLVRFNQAKIYVDCILELTTGALYEPYMDPFAVGEDQMGFKYFGDTLTTVSQTLSNAGFQLHYHVTGDRGAGLALDAIAASNPAPGPHRLTHCFLVHEKDRGRFAELNVVADFQSAPSSVAQDYIDFLQYDLLGEERAQEVIPLKALYEAGAMITLSSDWDADTLSPLVKLQTVLTRPNGKNMDRLETVLPMLTRNVATLLNTNTGSLEQGKLADLVVLDQNIFELPVDSIADAKVLATVFNGKVVYDPDGIVGERMGMPPPPPPDESSAIIGVSAGSFWVLMAGPIVMITFLISR